jgi:hypothetical protein
MRPDDKSGDGPEKDTLIIRRKLNDDGNYTPAKELRVSRFLLAFGYTVGCDDSFSKPTPQLKTGTLSL